MTNVENQLDKKLKSLQNDISSLSLRLTSYNSDPGMCNNMFTNTIHTPSISMII